MDEKRATHKVLAKEQLIRRRKGDKSSGSWAVDEENGVALTEIWYLSWPLSKPDPSGFREVGLQGTEVEVLDHIQRVWLDMPPTAQRVLDRVRRRAQGSI